MPRLHAIKKVTVARKLNVKLEATLPKGVHDLKIYFVSDSFIGADQEHELLGVKVAEAEDSDEEEDSDDAMEE